MATLKETNVECWNETAREQLTPMLNLDVLLSHPSTPTTPTRTVSLYNKVTPLLYYVIIPTSL